MAWTDEARQAAIIARQGHGMKQAKARSAAGVYGADRGNIAAARMLAQGGPPSKAGPAPVHAAMSYNRDLALRARNGQVGGGMTFRG